MRFSAMAEEFERQLADPDSYSQLSFEDRMGLLVDAEWNRRQVNKYKRLVNAAHFSVPSATVEGIEYYEDRKLDKAQIVRFSTCQYIERGHHIVLKGASGNGKTYIACALGNAACRKYHSVRYRFLRFSFFLPLSKRSSPALSTLLTPGIRFYLKGNY